MNVKKYIFSFLVLILCIILSSFGTYYFISKNPTHFQKIITKSEKSVSIDDSGISEAVNKVYDAVVTVSTYVNVNPYASGTGFVYKIVGDKAYILTNHHVINSADEVYVTFTNDNTEKVEVVGSYEKADIAVLSINKDKIIKVASLGSSLNSKIGDTVFAVGAPLDNTYSWSVTRGIVSGKDRLVEVSSQQNGYMSSSETYIMNVLQTDAAINSGNSGGPLANGNGEVIGITSMKLVSSGVEGMGFAIPIETAIKYSEKIINKEEIRNPYFGISSLNLNEAYYYREFSNLLKNVDVDYGIVVVEVAKSSPAEKAGLKTGDVITKINGKKCSSVAYLIYLLSNAQANDKFSITYLRDNKEFNTSVTLVEK